MRDFIDIDIDEHYTVGSMITTLDLRNIHNNIININSNSLNSSDVLVLSIDYFIKLISKSKVEEIRYILEQDKQSNIYINIHDKDHDTLLHLAVHANKPDIVELLLSYGADPNKYDINGQTPIYRCVLSNNPKNIDILLKNGALINMKDIDGNTPLHYAVLAKNYVIIEALLKNKAKKNIMNNNNLFPIDYAISKDNENILVDNKIIKLFEFY